jgi:murein L,D-transpeptidase YcbB/YkuD
MQTLRSTRPRRLTTIWIALAVFSFRALIAVHDVSAMGGGDARIAEASQDSTALAIARELRDAAPIDGYQTHRWGHVRRLYQARANAPLWLSPDGALNDRAVTLVDSVCNAPAQGLRLDVYPLRLLRDALGSRDRSRNSAAVRARVDVLLTAALVSYAEDLLTGQVAPRSVNRAWHIDPKDVDVDSALTRTLRQQPFAAALARLRPQDSDYDALVGALARYRAIVAQGPWPRVPDAGVLRPGDSSTVGALSALRSRVSAEVSGELAPIQPLASSGTAPDTSSELRRMARYDTALAGAVARYQELHGLAVDSVLGPNTLASLNRPAEYRLRQIAANLERHRWMPHDRGDRYVIVNVPAFRLRAYDEGREVLSMNVVVGAEYGGRSTPVFSDSMAYVVFRPYWNVPSSIASRELWPKQRRDPAYFRRNGYEVVNASWGTYVRQRPGAGNALGYVKFIFPNDFNIYLHDTPARHLFAEDVRALSHGCIRVEHPDELARFVLGPQGWDLAQARAAMNGGRDDHRVYLKRKLPVYIAYFTSYVRDGKLRFANDVYDRDAALMRAVTSAAIPPATWASEAKALRDATGTVR